MKEFLERTLEGLREAAREDPNNGPLWLQVAEILIELERPEESRAALADATRLLEGRFPDRVAALRSRINPEPEADEEDEDDEEEGDENEDDENEDGQLLRLVRGGAPGGDEEDELTIPEHDRIDFSDVGGLSKIKEDIRMRIVLPFQKPEIFAAYGRKRGGGILMYGPPGCGKTMLARATAGEVGATFLNVAIDQVLDMWFGGSEQKLAALFEDARRRAPTVLFFDEVEAIGANRQQIRNSPGKTLVNQLLSEMDGLRGANDRVLVMAATNAPWHVDPALLRPGRFDRVVFVPPPDPEARETILKLHLRDRPTESGLQLKKLIKSTAGYSGADLAGIVESATEAPLQEALRTGEMRPITHKDLLGAASAARSTTADWFATARNYASFANTGGLYDDLVQHLDQTRKTRKRF